jgi:hypothetical protein
MITGLRIHLHVDCVFRLIGELDNMPESACRSEFARGKYALAMRLLGSRDGVEALTVPEQLCAAMWI